MKKKIIRLFACVSFITIICNGIFGQQPYKINPAIGFQTLDSEGLNVSFQAAYLIEINEGFEVDQNSEFFADVIGGCDEGF
jgi:hypothetical protein